MVAQSASRRRSRLAVSALALALALTPSAEAQNFARKKGAPATEDEPALLTADQLVYDRDFGLVTARGHIEIDQGGRTLKADNLSYNMKQDVIIATGHVSLTETTGEVTYVDYIEISGDMKEAASRGIRILMIDDSRLAARYGRRIDGDLTVLDKVVYTACKPCEEAPEREPVWSIKGDRVVHDGETHLIEYENAWLEMGGVPIFYTPYLSHADPSIRRVSGWLPPLVMNNRVVGTGVRVPYFQVIDESQDISLMPMVTSYGDTGIGTVYRYKDRSGEIKISASATNLNAPNYTGLATIGWHIDSHALFELDENWRVGFQAQRTSDRNYLPTMGIHEVQPFLTVRPFVEDFTFRNYFAVEGYAFQSLSATQVAIGADDPRKDPVVFPMATYAFVSEPGIWNSYVTFDLHSAAIGRLHGTSDRQINSRTTWHLPLTTDDGEQFRLNASVRADAYNSNHVGDLPGTQNATRTVPDLSLEWRYPFVSIGEHSSQTFTPIVMLAASPNSANSEIIPNNDGINFELDDVNIFSPYPVGGWDKILTGPRVAYGFDYNVVNRGEESAGLLLGQEYITNQQSIVQDGAGFDRQLSDIVGRLAVSPSHNVSAQYRFRLDSHSLRPKRNEITMLLGPKPLNLQLGYVFYDRLSDTSPFSSREQMTATLSTQFSHYWSGQAYTIQNLGVKVPGAITNPGPLQSGLRLNYEDECLLVTADGGTRHTTSPVFNLGHYFTLRFVFKTLGQLPVDLF